MNKQLEYTISRYRMKENNQQSSPFRRARYSCSKAVPLDPIECFPNHCENILITSCWDNIGTILLNVFVTTCEF